MITVDKNAKCSVVAYELLHDNSPLSIVDRIFEAVDSGALSPDCIYLTLEPLPIVEYAVKEARKRMIPVFCDAGPHTKTLSADALRNIDIIAPNEIEAEQLTGIAVHTIAAAKRAARMLASQGPREVLITLGPKGAYYFNAASGAEQTVRAVPVQAIDETGAGDAFRAAFVHEWLRTKDVQKALGKARLAGAYAVTHLGGYDAMPTVAQLKHISVV